LPSPCLLPRPPPPPPLHSFPTRRSSDLPPLRRSSPSTGSGNSRRFHEQPKNFEWHLGSRLAGPGRPDIGRQSGRTEDVPRFVGRSEEHTSELQSRFDLVCRLLLEKKKTD